MNLGIGTAMASAQMYSTSRPVQPTAQDAPIPLPADPIDPLAGPSGATAQTGGFVQGGTSPTSSHPSGFGGGFGGGLASSPNVPRPGSSIDPVTGKPHTAGLTRAELEAKKAAEASSSSALTIDGKRLDDLSGREQAARQLTGTADDVITPGHELPGGWGPAKQVGVPGSGPNATSSVYEDIAEGLEKVGTAAYNLIPKGLKDALNPDLPLDKGKQPEGSPPPRRRSSVVAFLDNVKQGTGAFLHDVTDTFQSDRRVSLSSIGSNRGAGANSVSGATSHTNEPSVLAQVKTFFAETVDAIEGNTNAKVAGTAGSVAPRTSLPSNETAGALPGEHSTGVGALPGNATESGVAVLPEEKKLDPDLPLGNQGLRPGETPAGLGASSSVVAAIPEEDTPAATPAVEAAEADLGLQDEAVSTGTSVGLAPPLPATFLGKGAAEGATDLEQAGLPSAEEITDPKDVTSPAAAAIHEPSDAADSRHANDRTTSTASITAIRHGHEGQRPSPLAESTVPETEALTSTNATSNATSLTPGAEADGVGHPSSRTEETTREPGSYPDADHSTVTGSSVAPTTTTSVPANGDALKSDLTHSEHETSRDSSIPVTPKSPSTKLQSHSPPHTATDKAIGHQRSGSNVSTGSNGKKKVGFMKKLKGEMKVIGGKLANDEKKVEEGQKIKHGEL